MFVYIIECTDGSLYTGIAKDVVARLKEHYHRLPGCAKYTRSHPMKLIRCIWQTEDKVTACQLEYRIKRLTRKQKDALIANPESISELPINGVAKRISTDKQKEIFEQL
ncbi:MAG: GIY-YIG nuclease family protein [Bacteroidales bacterium]|nr:GIY-YIG nuclease family protein [Bacteroidales bacterium]